MFRIRADVESPKIFELTIKADWVGKTFEDIIPKADQVWSCNPMTTPSEFEHWKTTLEQLFPRFLVSLSVQETVAFPRDRIAARMEDTVWDDNRGDSDIRCLLQKIQGHLLRPGH